MSFFFKSSKSKQPQPPGTALPQASRSIKSSEGPGSSIPTPNGAPTIAASQRSKSPPLGTSANGSINSALMEKAPNRSLDGSDPNYEKVAISMTPSPEHKALRERSDSENRAGPPVSCDPANAFTNALTCLPNRAALVWHLKDLLQTLHPTHGRSVN